MLKAFGFYDIFNSVDSMFAELFGPTTQNSCGFIRTEQGYQLTLEVPGYASEDLQIKINLTTNTLTVSLKRTEQGKQFSFSYSVPQDVDKTKVSGVCKNGLCTITALLLQKTGSVEQKTISVPVS